MPVIRVDDDVYDWLKSLATPFEDKPNTVLRRVAGLDRGGEQRPKMNAQSGATVSEFRLGNPDRHTGNPVRLTGKILSQRWNVDVRHALYHRDGTFYENLKRFPGALFDPRGYIVFRTENDYRNSPYLNIGPKKLNVQPGIASIPGYKRMV